MVGWVGQVVSLLEGKGYNGVSNAMCGIIGILSNQDVFKDLYQGLLSIQHRGQDSAGAITYDGHFHTKKGNGLVRDIFTPENVQRLRGNIGIGHTRYPTIGGVRGEDAQPFLVNSPFGIIMAHNGNVINYSELKKTLFEEYHRLLNSDNDVEVILNIFAQELAEQKAKPLKPQHVFKAVEEVFKRVKGGYSVVAYIAEQGIVELMDAGHREKYGNNARSAGPPFSTEVDKPAGCPQVTHAEQDGIGKRYLEKIRVKARRQHRPQQERKAKGDNITKNQRIRILIKNKTSRAAIVITATVKRMMAKRRAPTTPVNET